MIDKEDVEAWERDVVESRQLNREVSLSRGVWFDLVLRAAVIIKQQGDELDKCHARDVRDEEMIAKLREEVAGLRDEMRREQIESAKAERDAYNHGIAEGSAKW